MTNIGGDRPIRGCEACGGVDDHPRHITIAPQGEDALGVPNGEVVQHLLDNGISGAALVSIMDPQTLVRHLQCCAEAGCPDGTCTTQLDGADGLTGQALLDHLMGA